MDEGRQTFLGLPLPAVQLGSTVEDKYETLAESTFRFFRIHCGCHLRRKQIYNEPSRKPKYNRASKMVEQLKTKAQRDF